MHVLSYMLWRHPPESFSRKLDKIVGLQEKPYGYTESPPPADTGDFDQRKLESNKRYRTGEWR